MEDKIKAQSVTDAYDPKLQPFRGILAWIGPLKAQEKILYHQLAVKEILKEEKLKQEKLDLLNGLANALALDAAKKQEDSKIQTPKDQIIN